MGTCRAYLCSSVTIPRTDTEMAESEDCSLGQVINLSSGQRQLMLFSPGDYSETTALTSELDDRKKELIALSSATKEMQRAANWSGMQIELLMQSGLVAGITPTYVRRTLGADCRGLAFSTLAGDTPECEADDSGQNGTDY